MGWSCTIVTCRRPRDSMAAPMASVSCISGDTGTLAALSGWRCCPGRLGSAASLRSCCGGGIARLRHAPRTGCRSRGALLKRLLRKRGCPSVPCAADWLREKQLDLGTR